MKKIFLCLIFIIAVPSMVWGGSLDEFYIPVMGESIHIFDPGEGEPRNWYINDHCIVRGPDSRFHLFGITHAKEIIPPPWAEHDFAHASSDVLFRRGWDKHERVLRIDKDLGETHVWAPHVIEKDDLYYIFYAAGGCHWDSMINLATSQDLFEWERHPENPMFRDFYDARDPMVYKHGDEYVMYYTKTFSKEDYKATVAIRRSKDLVHWSEPEFALVLTKDPPAINSGHTESPYYFQYKGAHYLCICNPYYHYKLSRVFVSDDPFHFDEKDEITAFIAHCPEVLNFSGVWAVSHAGWFYNGVYLAPVKWIKAKKFEPQMVFINAGETNDYLTDEQGTKVTDAGLLRLAPMTKAIKIDAERYARYQVPMPKGVHLGQLFVCGKGDYEILVNSWPLSAEKDPSSSKALELYWIDTSRLSQPETLNIEFRVRTKEPFRLNWMRIYFIE
jgi:arabinan endo-1,5-alpha-L-arabinosidase